MWTVGGVGALLVGILVVLTVMDWNVLRGPVARFASASLDRRVTISGDLDVDIWSRRIAVNDLRVSGPSWAQQCDTIAVAAAGGRIRFLPLLFGRWVFDELELTGPRFCLRRTADDRASWRFRSRSDRTPNLPAITRFSIRDGHLSLNDEHRRLVFAAALTADDSGGGAEAFTLRGEGSINDEPFRATLWGPALRHVSRARPYRFRADVEAGAIRLLAAGRFDRPFDFAAFGARVWGRGPDLALLYPLLGVTLPNSSPYNLRAVVRRDGKVTRLTELSGVVGDTDVAGTIVADKSGPRLLLTADLTSRKLDFDDLAVLLGGVPDTSGGESASPAQRAQAQQLASQGRLLPDARLDVARARRMDARLKYRARSVETDYLPLRNFALDMTLQNGVLTARPLAFGLPRGDISGAVRIDARRDMPDVAVDLALDGARVEDFMARSSQPGALRGPLQGRIKLRGRGRSVREAAASADGRAWFVSRDGEIRAAFAELLGVNVVRGLGLLLTKDRQAAPVRCAVAGFDVRNGVMQANALVIDTGPVLVLGKGQVDLRDEGIALHLRGKPKEPRLIRVIVPVRIEGTLSDPHMGVELDAAAGQGAAAAVAAFFAPLAAVLPFVTLDLAEDADCAAIIALAQHGPGGPPRQQKAARGDAHPGG